MADIVNISGEARELPSKDVDAHGQAALMLAESMLHALVDMRTLTTEDALGIIQTAQEVKEEVGKEAGERSATIAVSLRLLDCIATSFGSDLN